MAVFSGKRPFEASVLTSGYDRTVKLLAYPVKAIGPKRVGAQDRKDLFACQVT